MYKFSFCLCAVIALTGCQSMTSKPAPKKTTKTPQTSQKQDVKPPTSPGVTIKPYEREEIKRQPVQVVVPVQKTVQKFDDGESLPAYKNLMSQSKAAYKSGQLANAESLALQAQRLAPQSAETFLYLSLISNEKNDAKNAESLAKRGLTYAQTDAIKRQLWLSIQRSAQKQNNTALAQEATTALKSL